MREDWARLYVDECLSTIQIGVRDGVSHQTVMRHLARLGIVRRNRGRAMERNHKWQGGLKLDSDGYVNIKMPKHRLADTRGYVRLSIVSWEEANGAPFPEGKEPHHIDLDRCNDAADNIRPLTHLEHALEHGRIRSIARRKPLP
jgi:hypothetical protein